MIAIVEKIPAGYFPAKGVRSATAGIPHIGGWPSGVSERIVAGNGQSQEMGEAP